MIYVDDDKLARIQEELEGHIRKLLDWYTLPPALDGYAPIGMAYAAIQALREEIEIINKQEVKEQL